MVEFYCRLKSRMEEPVYVDGTCESTVGTESVVGDVRCTSGTHVHRDEWQRPRTPTFRVEGPVIFFWPLSILNHHKPPHTSRVCLLSEQKGRLPVPPFSGKRRNFSFLPCGSLGKNFQGNTYKGPSFFVSGCKCKEKPFKIFGKLPRTFYEKYQTSMNVLSSYLKGQVGTYWTRP